MKERIFGVNGWRLWLILGFIIPTSSLIVWYIQDWRPSYEIGQLIAFTGSILALFMGKYYASSARATVSPVIMPVNVLGNIVTVFVMFGPMALVRLSGPDEVVPTATACCFIAFIWGMLVYMTHMHYWGDDFIKVLNSPDEKQIKKQG